MNNLPFELYPKHKSSTLNHWRKSGLNMDNVDEIYNRYIYCKECDFCCAPFKSRRDRQMDHCHNTGKFRNVICAKCNGRKIDKPIGGVLKEKLISKTFRKARNRYEYSFTLVRDKKIIIKTRSKDLDKVIKFRDEWIKNNPQHFS